MQLAALGQEFATITATEPSAQVLAVTLNRPERANSLTTRMAEELLVIFGALEAEPDAYRCVILTGAGDRVFCAGADLKERDGMSDADFTRQHYLYERCFRALLACPPPLIAAINGAAVAGGLEMALCCDFAYAVDTARFALTEVTRGIMPGGGGTQNLPRSIGERRAKEVIFTGQPFTAADALAWGVVNRLCAPGTVMQEALRTAGIIRDNAPLSVRQAKKAISQGLQMDRASGMLFEIEAYYQLIPTEDRVEGIKAYVEKRRPVFKGR
ncbi:enoyl-CoA hydratase-related protein [Siccirubricoccus sp. G192]|uniref:enoyl-CoA hydratase-related protein n=1 Tax=Siccirubricoccus sp. G192 TaxID=2849651 RepID=UPI001C2BB4A7|nr:enoyl-CoA hydratase-related protein [Siccirubricoccus sp. G192]MBV1797887.1 enoyl-CoA hydratase/isomerase family protein [Siccirubricoccus sp. G192]